MDLDRFGRASRLHEVRERPLPIALLESHPAPRVEELDVVSDRQIVERDSGDQRLGIVESRRARAAHGRGSRRGTRLPIDSCPKRRRFDEREVFLGEQELARLVAHKPSPQLMRRQRRDGRRAAARQR